MNSNSKTIYVSLRIIMILILLLPGCISNAPDADRHFYRNSALDTVRLFRYAIDAKQNSAAYDCLTKNVQAQISPLAFDALVRFVDVPELGGVGLKELLMDSSIDQIVEPVSGAEKCRWVTLIWSSDDQFIEYSLMLIPDESGTWWIDLLSTRGFDLGNTS